MQGMRELLTGLLFAAALGAIARLASTSENTRRVLRICTALFLITALGAGTVHLDRDLWRVDDVRPMQNAADAVLQTAAQAVEQTARQVLDAHGLPQAQIRVVMGVRGGEAHAETFLLFGVPPESAEEIRNEIFTLTGERPVTTAGKAAQP